MIVRRGDAVHDEIKDLALKITATLPGSDPALALNAMLLVMTHLFGAMKPEVRDAAIDALPSAVRMNLEIGRSGGMQ